MGYFCGGKIFMDFMVHTSISHYTVLLIHIAHIMYIQPITGTLFMLTKIKIKWGHVLCFKEFYTIN